MLVPSAVLTPSASGGGRNTSPLSQIPGIQAVFDLDATLSSSYSGSGQTWSNIIIAPADGSAQTAYDFYCGSSSSPSSDDPTFNGTANDPAAYWSFDGSDFFSLASGVNTTFFKNFAKSTGGVDVTIMCAMRTATTPGINYPLAFRGDSDPAANSMFAFTNSSNINLDQFDSSGTTHATTRSYSFTGSTDYLLAYRFNYSNTSSGGTAVNARSFTTSTLSRGTSTADQTNLARIGAWATNRGANGSYMYGVYCFNKILTDSDLSSVIDVLNSRHNRTYA